MRVGIIALLHESNTFVPIPTTMKHFEQNQLISGDAIRDQLADTHHEIGGFFEGLERAGHQAVPVFVARALPYGPITADAFEALMKILFDQLEQAGPLDGILVAPHGATVAESHPDADGHWLSELRAHVGPDMPLVGTMDPHANLSQRMVDATDMLVAYRSNPHLDQRARGLEAAGLMARRLAGQVRPTQAASFPPIAINIERQLTTAPPCAPLYALADSMLARPGMLSNSILLGFPYADVEEMGSGCLVVTDNDPALAARSAAELAGYLWSHRHEFLGQLSGIDEALDQAEKLDGPICLLDMGDNCGGGSPADSTHLARAIHDRKIPGVFVCLYDPDSVRRAESAGAGQRVRLSVGGKTDRLHGQPLEDEFTVLGLYDGEFHESQPRHGGYSHFDQGRTAVVRNDTGMTVQLNSIRMAPLSIHQLTSCNIDPASFHLLVAKGVMSPVAAYEPVCRHMIRVNTPGCTTADMTSLDFQHRRRPMFPFELDAVWENE